MKNRPSPIPETQKKSVLEKLSGLPAAARAAVLLAITGCFNGHGVEEKKVAAPGNLPDATLVGKAPEKGHDKGGDHGHEKHAELPPEVMAKLKENKEALELIDQIGVQAYFDKIHAESPVVVSEESVTELCLCCIDERQVKGQGHGIAGAGVLLTNEQLEVAVRNALSIAQKRAGPGRQTPTIRIKPHGASCGAAALARKLRKEKDMSPEAIAKEATGGAERTAALVRERAKDMGVEVNVVVEEYPQGEFLQDPNHPAALAFINYKDGTVANKESPTKNVTARAMMFHASALVGGKEVAEDDAVLAAVIAHLSHHGYLEDAQGVSKKTPFRIVPGVDTKEEAGEAKARLEAKIKANKDLAPLFEGGMLRVDPWIVPADAKKE